MENHSLSWSTRIQGFIICFVLGLLISILASLALFLHKGISLFVIFYTTGNVVSMLRYIYFSEFVFISNKSFTFCTNLIFFSTCFLMGPVNQLKRMFAETRIFATILVFVMMGLTLFAALYVCYIYMN